MRGGSPRPCFQLGFQLLGLISKKIYLALLVFKILTTDSNVVLLEAQALEDEYEQDWHLTIYYVLRLSLHFNPTCLKCKSPRNKSYLPRYFILQLLASTKQEKMQNV